VIKVLIQQNVIPHYRRRLFELLCADGDVRFSICSGLHSDSPGVAVVNPGITPIRWEICSPRKISPRFYWHPDLIGLIRREKPDAIIMQGNPYLLSAWMVLVWGLVKRRPVLLWTHGLLTQGHGWKSFIRLKFYKLAAALLLYGEHAKTLLTIKGINPHKMFCVFNSLDYEAQRQAAAALTRSDIAMFRSGLGIAEQDRLVVFSGRLQANKKLSLLLEAVATLRGRGRSAHVAFIGDGPEQHLLAAYAAKSGIRSQVHFLGESYDEVRIATVYSAGDLAVIPSGAGLSIMHALAYGVPVLIHDRPAEHFPEWEAVREGETGFFYRFGDVNDMADKIEKALFPVARKAHMQAACHAMIRKRYHPVAHAGAIVSAVKQVIGQTR
jgi:glycosyltransferase involved in cell wall biosynthesis